MTDQEVIIVELPLSAPPDTRWRATFEQRVAAARHHAVGWAHVEPIESGHAVVFRLTDQDDMLGAVARLDAQIADTTEAWLREPAVAEVIAKQQRIDALQQYLDRVARA